MGKKPKTVKVLIKTIGIRKVTPAPGQTRVTLFEGYYCSVVVDLASADFNSMLLNGSLFSTNSAIPKQLGHKN